MGTRTTARGKSLNMEALMAENEEIIAMGNARMNARGDTLGAGSEVVATVQQTSTAYYKENPNENYRLRKSLKLCFRKNGISYFTRSTEISINITAKESGLKIPF